MMSDINEPPGRGRAQDARLVVNGNYLREQASEAVSTFLAPLLGVYGAATGMRVRLYRGPRRQKRAA